MKKNDKELEKEIMKMLAPDKTFEEIVKEIDYHFTEGINYKRMLDGGYINEDEYIKLIESVVINAAYYNELLHIISE